MGEFRPNQIRFESGAPSFIMGSVDALRIEDFDPGVHTEELERELAEINRQDAATEIASLERQFNLTLASEEEA